MEKSSLFTVKPFYTSKEIHKVIPEVFDEWKPSECMFTESLEERLGPLGQFKHASFKDTKEKAPDFLKTNPKPRIVETIKNVAKEAARYLSEERNSEKSTLIENANEFEHTKDETEFKPTGITILINKSTMKTEIVKKDLKAEPKQLKRTQKNAKMSHGKKKNGIKKLKL